MYFLPFFDSCSWIVEGFCFFFFNLLFSVPAAAFLLSQRTQINGGEEKKCTDVKNRCLKRAFLKLPIGEFSCWKWGKEDGRQYYRGLIIQPSEMKRERRRTETNNGITGWCSWFHFLSLFWHLKNSFSKMHHLPFNQPPITESKGFRDEAADKTRFLRFCPCFNVRDNWKYHLKDSR